LRKIDADREASDKPSDKKLQIIPLGGLGEFGMNSMAIRYGDDIIVIDAGMMFPDAELMGVDIVTPDFATSSRIPKKFAR
jgi:mRNA degradation ribonuclease J1/J2